MISAVRYAAPVAALLLVTTPAAWCQEWRASARFGRVTYEGFAAAWPQRSGDPFSDKFNAMPKYVVSTTLENPGWNNSHVVRGDVADEIRRLKAEQNLLVWGSPSLVRFLADEGLDESPEPATPGS